jgi:hypothetical protein
MPTVVLCIVTGCVTKREHLKAETANAWKYTRKESSSVCAVTWLVMKSIHCLLLAREHIHFISVIPSVCQAPTITLQLRE